MKFRHPLRSFLCWACGLLLFLAGCAFVLPAQFDGTYAAALRDKAARLGESEGKRIILIGGSCVPFGVDSALMEEQLPGYTVADFGLYAEMGVTVMLDLAAPELRAGDLVVLMPEQSAISLSDHLSGETLWQAADGDFGLLTRLKPQRLTALAAAFPGFAARKLYYAITGRPETEDIYARSSFSAEGDIRAGMRPQNILPGGYQPDAVISFSAELPSDAFVSEVQAFVKHAEAAGAQVLWHAPPMNSAALEAGTSAAAIDSWYTALRERTGVPLLGNPHHCLLDSGWFYDSNFHLNDAGVLVFTKMLVEDLKVWLEDTSATEIALPAMPAATVTAAEGDNSDAACFIYTANADGWLITGLTEEGRAAERLTVPVSWQGSPVTDLSPDLFHGCASLREVVIQPNIRLLYDGMFSGCTGLRRLVLKDGTPGGCSVGDALTEGAPSFLIVVPADRTDDFRLSYFWQKYAERIAGE